MAESDRCCGMGGAYSFEFPDMSRSMLGRKLASARLSGAPMVAVDCPGCLLQIGGGLDRAGGTMETCHVAELLARRIDAAAPLGGSPS
jgi:Fe-S oxidoreductase